MPPAPVTVPPLPPDPDIYPLVDAPVPGPHVAADPYRVVSPLASVPEEPGVGIPASPPSPMFCSSAQENLVSKNPPQ